MCNGELTFEIYSFCLMKAGAGIYSEKSFNGKYMLEVVAAKKHSSTAKMETVPGFYAIYSRIFLKIMRTTDLQESVQNSGGDCCDFHFLKKQG